MSDRPSRTHTPVKIPHPPSTRFYDHDVSGSEDELVHDDSFETPNPKRRRTDVSMEMNSPKRSPLSSKPGLSQYASSTSPQPRTLKLLQDTERTAESGAERDSYDVGFEDDHHNTASQLENALPQIHTDAEAIEAYEAYRAAQSSQAGGPDGGNSTVEERLRSRSWEGGKSSIYVDAFNLALLTVLEDEGHLFNEKEKEIFKYWNGLCYEAQYLYVRLFLRKTSTWFRIGKLTYYDDIADMETAVKELQDQRQLPEDEEEIERFPGEKAIPDEALPLGQTFNFAESSVDNITTLNEASSLLLLDELKTIAKEAKVNGKNKTELLNNLRRTSGKQRGLDFIKRSDSENSAVDERRSSVHKTNEADDNCDEAAEGTKTPNASINRDEHFTKKILEQTGRCIRLSLIPLKLFERVHLVFYRSTEWTEKSLTTLILAKISRRNFPEYIVSRSATIFESRSLLLEFEASLRTQFRVDSILEFNGTPSRRGLEEVKAIFEAVYPRWKTLLDKEQSKEDRVYESGEGAYLRRFSPAWVYTRIVHKALAILAKFKEHLREHGLICELLEQRLFHAARRGSWYTRKALLEEHYMYALRPLDNRSEEANKKHWKRIALETCQQGLQDNECHVIYHYDLQKRIKKLERQLRVPKREQHDFGHVGLLKARERTVEGVKLEKLEDSRPQLRRRSSTSSDPNRSRSRERNGSNEAAKQPSEPVLKRQSTRTTWSDELDTELPVTVESMCLSHYRKILGYKGYHSEGGILRTLFGLLFYNVMFSIYVPNVFQTAYQTCPLDLHTDAFYSTRISEINHLINRITNGEAEDILRSTWTDHSERKTCIVGVRWDDYELDDLVEIVRCWDGEALGVVMRVIAQEYAGRGGGVPDLFLWQVHRDLKDDDDEGKGRDNENDPVEKAHNQAVPLAANTRNTYGKVMFSEVKSENDRLSDTQRLWISVLLNAGVEVELCHAVAKEIIKQ